MQGVNTRTTGIFNISKYYYIDKRLLKNPPGCIAGPRQYPSLHEK